MHFSVQESYIFGTLKTNTVKYALHQSYFTKESLKCENDFICFKSYVQLHYSSRVWCRIFWSLTMIKNRDIDRHSTHTRVYFLSISYTPVYRSCLYIYVILKMDDDWTFTLTVICHFYRGMTINWVTQATRTPKLR